MTLRQELGLFFGGLLLVVLSLVVGINYVGLKDRLEDGLKKQFSTQPFQRAAQSERQILLERARTLVSNQLVNSYRRNVVSSLENDVDAVTALQKARENDAEHRNLHAELYTLYDQALGVLNRVGTESANDLVAIAAEDGTVLLEVLGVGYETFAEVADFDIGIKAQNLSLGDFWSSVKQRGDLKGYLVYPDHHLYLVGASWFQKGPYFDGLAAVGTVVDQEFLENVAGDSLVFVIYGDQVVGSSLEAQDLGQAMRERTKPWPEGEGEETWTAPDGKTYLVKSQSLQSFYLPKTPENEAVESGSMVRPTEVGRVAFLRDMAIVEAAAFEQSRLSLLFGVVALVLALLLVPVVARRFTGPIGQLSASMNDVGRGVLEQIPIQNISTIREVREASLSFNQMIIGLRQKKALETFVPEGTRAEVEASGGAAPELGGKRLERTILFSDLRGFTSMSERLPATQVMEVLNLYLECMTRAIRLEQGDINEYIGDAILAVFESPDAAVRAARAMNQELERLRAGSLSEELKSLGQGIGIHTGAIVEGNIGERNARMKRAVVGDTVNLAARIQDRSRAGQYTAIFLSGATKDKLTDEVPLEFFGDEEFKGKAEPIPVWEVREPTA